MSKLPIYKQAPALITWHDDASKTKAFKEFGQAIGHSTPVYRTEGYSNYPTSFRDITTDTSARTPFTRQTYDYFRPNERIPTDYKEILHFCTEVYRRCSIVHQIVDLMADFSTKGIRIVHENPEKQKYLEQWWTKVRGKHVSERTINSVLRLGVSYIRRYTVKLTERQQEQVLAGADGGYTPAVKPERNEIPLKYILYSPLHIDNVGGIVGGMVGKPRYAINLPESVKRAINNPNSVEKGLVDELPQEIKAAAKNGGRLLLPPDKMSVLYYKKDDWEEWAYPMIYPILDDIVTLEKAKLADRAALDGVISKVRVWKLGSLEHKIIPGPDAIAKFSEFLMNNVGGGTIDIVWGPAVELLETDDTSLNVLGEEKYKPVLNSIYAGLGVPPTLTGSPVGGGFTNNSTSLKTLIERLQYVRDIITEFWNQELKLVQQAKGWRTPGKVQFDKTILTDETAEKALLIQLVDRDIISYESVRERFGEIPELEDRRVNREYKRRDKELMPPKADSFHNPMIEDELRKIALQNGEVTPSEVGLELNERKEGEVPAADKKAELEKAKMSHQATLIKQKGIAGQGRPIGKKDGKKRKAKTVKPIRGVAAITAWATQAQKDIAEILNPGLLHVFNKKNARMLTEGEFKQCENIKFAALSRLKPFEEITQDKVVQGLTNTIDSGLNDMLEDSVTTFINSQGRDPNLDELKSIQATIYSIWCINKQGE